MNKCIKYEKCKDNVNICFADDCPDCKLNECVCRDCPALQKVRSSKAEKT